jgi:cardiolipin synthase
VLIVGAVVLAWLLDRGMEIRPLLVGKINTGLQIALAAGILAEHGFALGWMSYLMPLIWITALLTGLSAMLYLAAWLRHMASYDIKASAKKTGSGLGVVL